MRAPPATWSCAAPASPGCSEKLYAPGVLPATSVSVPVIVWKGVGPPPLKYSALYPTLASRVSTVKSFASGVSWIVQPFFAAVSV